MYPWSQTKKMQHEDVYLFGMNILKLKKSRKHSFELESLISKGWWVYTSAICQETRKSLI